MFRVLIKDSKTGPGLRYTQNTTKVPQREVGGEGSGVR